MQKFEYLNRTQDVEMLLQRTDLPHVSQHSNGPSMSRNKVKSRTINDSIFNQVIECNEIPYLYSVIQFGFYDDYGFKLPLREIRKFWDKDEVNKTAVLLRNMLKETFNMTGVWIFKERHDDTIRRDARSGEKVIRKGRFHLNIITTNIPDDAIENPNRKCRRLWTEEGRMGVPIENLVYNDLDQLKIELFNACCRRAEWVNRYKPAIKTQWLDDPTDVHATVEYCMKDHTNGTMKLDDVVISKACDFYKP